MANRFAPGQLRFLTAVVLSTFRSLRFVGPENPLWRVVNYVCMLQNETLQLAFKPWSKASKTKKPCDYTV